VPLSHMEVHLEGAQFDSTQLTSSGIFEFENVLLENDLTLTPFRNGDDVNGVNTIDMVLIRKHILGITYFDSPYKLLAADVNQSGTVTTFDLVIIRKVILHMIPNFPIDSWLFIDADYDFQNPENPYWEDYPKVKNFSPTAGEEYNFDFIGIKIGDVNGNAIPF
ncbi:MAG: dockerin type I domain-containing protein, partial [Bacteroidota bacterium]